MRKLKALIICMLMGYILAVPTSGIAAGPTVLGSGSTFSKVAMDQWVADVQRLDLSINFQGNGSTGGRQNYLERQVDFAVSEIPFEPGERAQLASKGLSYQYLPIVAGGTSLMYNLKTTSGAKITNLRLSGEVAAKIFTGKISKWNDPAIRAENSNRADLPDKIITPVIRSDGSGTSAQFSAYLVKQFPAVWSGFAPNEPTSVWPTFPRAVGAARSDGVANFVASNDASITYVEAAYAEQRGVPVAAMKNASGNYAPPNAGNVARALEKAAFNEDRTQRLDAVYTHPDPTAYPISSYSYMITPTAEKDLSKEKGAVLGKFMIYFACTGQKSADRLGYSPLPKVLVAEVFEAVTRVPGAPAPPNIDTGCDNPTITGNAPAPTQPVVNPPAPPAAPGAAPAAPGAAPAAPGAAPAAPGAAPAAPGAAPARPGATTGAPRPGSSAAPRPGATTGAPRPGSTAAPRPGSTSSPRPGTAAARRGGTTGGSTRPGTTGTGSGTGAGTTGGGTTTTTDPVTGEVVTTDLPVDNTALGQRVEGLEQRVGELETLVYGSGPVEDGPVNAELKKELLLASSKVQPAGATGSAVAVAALAAMVLGPYFGGSATRIRSRIFRRRYLR